MLKYRELEVFDREVKQTQICEYRPCYVYGRTHVGTSDVAKCGEVYPHLNFSVIFLALNVVNQIRSKVPDKL